MDDDIVARLRSPANVFYEYAADDGALLRQAAAEIERLRAALRTERYNVISEVLFLIEGHLLYAGMSVEDDMCLLNSIQKLAGKQTND